MNVSDRKRAESAEPSSAALDVKFIDLAGRIRLEYVEHGNSTGQPVLLLPGLADFWRSFEPVLPHLPASIRAFAISQRGHGNTDRPALGYGPRDFAADLGTFVDALDLRRSVIVGHSMSTIVAQRFALDYPTRTRGLVLVAWRGYPRPSTVAALGSLTDLIDPGFVRAFQEASLARPVPPAFVDAVIQDSLKVPARVWRGVIEGFQADNFSAETAKISVPTLIAWGDRDATCPRSEQEALATSIPGARLVSYPGAGHCLHWEEPARFAADLSAFVARITG